VKDIQGEDHSVEILGVKPGSDPTGVKRVVGRNEPTETKIVEQRPNG